MVEPSHSVWHHWGPVCSDVNKDLRLKIKAEAKDLSRKAKAKD